MRHFTIAQFIKLELNEERNWARNGYNDDCRIPDLIDVNGNRVDPYEAKKNETYFIVRPVGFLGKRKRTKWATVEKLGFTQPYYQKELEHALECRLRTLLKLTDKVVDISY